MREVSLSPGFANCKMQHIRSDEGVAPYIYSLSVDTKCRERCLHRSALAIESLIFLHCLFSLFLSLRDLHHYSAFHTLSEQLAAVFVNAFYRACGVVGVRGAASAAI